MVKNYNKTSEEFCQVEFSSEFLPHEIDPRINQTNLFALVKGRTGFALQLTEGHVVGLEQRWGGSEENDVTQRPVKN